MEFIRKVEKNKMLTVYLVGFLFVILNTFLIMKEIYYLPLLPVILIFFVLLVNSLEKTVFLIVFFVPVSVLLTEFFPDLPFDLYLPTEPLLAGVMIIYFLKYLMGDRLDIRILRHPVTLAIYFHLAWMFITTLTSTMPLISAKYLVMRIWFLISFYFLAAQIFQSRKKIDKYIWLYVITFSLFIAYALIRHVGYGLTNQAASNYVVRPFYSDHTSYGAILAMLLPVLLFLFAAYRNIRTSHKILFLLFIGYFLTATLFSYTRAAWVSLIGVLGIWILIRLKIRFHFVLLGAAALIGLYLTFQTEIMMKLEQNKQDSSGKFSEHVQSISNIQTDASNLERINRWSSAIRMFKEKPVFGWGPGTYMFKYAPYQRSYQRTIISTNTGSRGNAHSEYLGPLSESGVLGMFSVLLIMATTLFTSFRVYYNTRQRKTRLLSLGLMLGLITYYIHGVLNNFLDTDKVSVLFWGYTAMLVAMDIYHRGEK